MVAIWVRLLGLLFLFMGIGTMYMGLKALSDPKEFLLSSQKFRRYCDEEDAENRWLQRLAIGLGVVSLLTTPGLFFIAFVFLPIP